ncbi:MAG: S-adenosyl-l-methionine hydroxide adenosyltransferase family protein [Bulleidia sp.]
MKPSIVIQTDFSLSWGAVAEMKGVMKRVDPELDLVDLCHEIRNYDPWEASLSLAAVEPYWPAGTIFVSVVDPGVGTDRRASAALLKDGNYVVTPDNGTLTHLLHEPGVQKIREIDERVNRCHGPEEVSVFDGRDLFGYCAARLAAGLISFENVGPEYPVSEIAECPEYHLDPVLSSGYLEGWILTGNRHFGGIEFNVTNEAFRKEGYSFGDLFHVAIMHEGKVLFDQIVPYEKSFGFVRKGQPVLYQGSSRYLSLDLNCGNLMEKYHLDTGAEWKFRMEKMK